MEHFTPTLTEPGVSYFLKETLKNCRKKKNIQYNYLFNLALFFLFIIISASLLYYKFKTKPNKEDKQKLKTLKRNYFINKVRQLQSKKAQELNKSITNLPNFESPFELLHKNFYKV
jgi:hypothetical protein